jgi:hypothetical protein
MKPMAEKTASRMKLPEETEGYLEHPMQGNQQPVTSGCANLANTVMYCSFGTPGRLASSS